MANSDIPDGFAPYNNPHGGNGQPTVTEHSLNASNSEIGVGSPVRLVAGGMDLAAAGGTLGLSGIAAEAKAASAGGTIKLFSDPDQLFVAQTDNGTGTGTAAAAIGLNIQFVGTGVTNGRSTAEIDEDTAATTATDQFRIIELSKERVGKVVNAHGEFVRLVVKINNHQALGGTGTVGI